MSYAGAFSEDEEALIAQVQGLWGKKSTGCSCTGHSGEPKKSFAYREQAHQWRKITKRRGNARIYQCPEGRFHLTKKGKK